MHHLLFSKSTLSSLETASFDYENVDLIAYKEAEIEEESIDKIDGINEIESFDSSEPKIRKNFPETFIWDNFQYVIFFK